MMSDARGKVDHQFNPFDLNHVASRRLKCRLSCASIGKTALHTNNPNLVRRIGVLGTEKLGVCTG